MADSKVKRMASIVASLVTITGGLIASAPAASASGYGCSGSEVSHYNLYNGSTLWGVTHLYYSTSAGGTNCAVTVDTHFGSSSAKYMGVHLYLCRAGTTAGTPFCNWDVGDTQDAFYYTYAGPVTITGTAGRCIEIGGFENNPAGLVSAQFETAATHCG